MSLWVTVWTSECIHIGSVLCVCEDVCVCFPATSIQQQGISEPDVCDLWSGRSCGGEASNVLNIISHRWSPTALTHIRTPTSLFHPFLRCCFCIIFLCVQETHVLRGFKCRLTPWWPHWCFFNGIFHCGWPGGLVPYGFGMRLNRQGDGWWWAIHDSHKALLEKGRWTENKQNLELKRDNKKAEPLDKMIFMATLDLRNPLEISNFSPFPFSLYFPNPDILKGGGVGGEWGFVEQDRVTQTVTSPD